ncbi:MAG: KOW domain-containing RNA-binding protein [Ruminococcus sp.]|nr:KOW domain-containing RNA-binding protein [Ruminococcus sp.]
MSIEKGSIVRAMAGRDKENFFVVLEVDSKYALIADGKRRKVEHPKKKKLIHLAPTKTVIEGSLETNPQIKRVLSQFKNGG